MSRYRLTGTLKVGVSIVVEFEADEVDVFADVFAGNGSNGGLVGLALPDSAEQSSVWFDTSDCFPEWDIVEEVEG